MHVMGKFLMKLSWKRYVACYGNCHSYDTVKKVNSEKVSKKMVKKTQDN